MPTRRAAPGCEGAACPGAARGLLGRGLERRTACTGAACAAAWLTEASGTPSTGIRPPVHAVPACGARALRRCASPARERPVQLAGVTGQAPLTRPSTQLGSVGEPGRVLVHGPRWRSASGRTQRNPGVRCCAVTSRLPGSWLPAFFLFFFLLLL